jgi:hypothetical protein
MSRFTDFEKKVIQAIVDLHKEKSLCVLGNIWERFFPSTYYVNIEDSKSPKLMIKTSAFETMNNLSLQDMLNLLSEKCEVLNSLFRFLEVNGYLKLAGDYKLSTLGQVFGDEKYAVYTLNVLPEVFQPIALLARRHILPSQILLELPAHGFLTAEELRIEKQEAKLEKQAKDNLRNLRYTQIGLCIAAIGLFITAVDTFVKWCETETRVIIVNGEKTTNPIRNVPIVVEERNSGHKAHVPNQSPVISRPAEPNYIPSNSTPPLDMPGQKPPTDPSEGGDNSRPEPTKEIRVTP